MTRRKLSIFEAVAKRKFGRNTCFLCGCRIGSRNRSNEDIIPRWILTRYNLRDQMLILPNSTSIPYRQLKIPCCRTCNNKHLSPYERKVQRAVMKGPSAVRALDPKILYIWLGKIYYGLLYRDVLLPLNRSKPRGQTIILKSHLKEYRSLHLFIQAARIPITFMNFFPASIFIFKVQEPDLPQHQFDLRDTLFPLWISLRLGKTAIIASLQDGGALRYELDGFYRDFQNMSLHPFQYLEIAARFFYHSTLMDRTPKYVSQTIDNKGISVVQMPLQGLSTKPIFREFEPKHFASILSRFTGFPEDQLYSPPNLVWTSLQLKGKKIRIPLSKHPFPLER